MCIAITKPIGVDLPSDEILKTCFYNNHDGGGFAFNDNGEVVIKKGYMKLEDFLSAIHSADKKYNLKDRGMLIHTRITTHGGTNASMTHPFPICADEGALKKTYYRSPFAVVHNGVISLTSTEALRRDSMSDTAVFVEKYLSKIAQNDDWFHNKANIELIEDLIDSKMAILNSDGEIIKTDGFTEDNGIFYSNSSYKDNWRKYTKYYYDYYDDYDYGSHYLAYHDGKKGYWEKNKDGTYIFKEYTDTDNSKKEKEESAKDEKTVSLMKLQRGEIVALDDGTEEEYYPDIQYYLTEYYEVYYSIDSDDEKNIKGVLHFLGLGDFLNAKTFEPIPFREDCFIPPHNLDGLDDMGYID